MNLIDKELTLLEKEIKNDLLNDLNQISNDISNFVFSKSKKLRPSLIFLLSKALNINISEEIIYLACATELLHNSTLIHDDIVDNATLRRGKQSLNIKLGNNLSVLAGDFLLSKSMLFLAKCNNLNVFTTFSNCLKTMCKGEINQYFELNKVPSMQEYIEKSINKTSKLFEASLVSLFQINKLENIKDISEFAINFGLAFQIKDDLNNILTTDKTKPALNDIYNGSYNAPIIFLKEDYNNIESLDKKEIIRLSKNEKIKNRTIDLIKQYATKAIDSIDFIKDNQYKEEIIKLTQNLYKVV